MTVIKTDTFTATPSDVPLETWVSDTGGEWQGDESHFDVLAATTNLACTNASVVGAIGDEDPTETDYFAEVEIQLNGTSTVDRGGVIVRAQGGVDFVATSGYQYYFLRLTGGALGAVGWILYRHNLTSPSQVGFTGTSSGTFTDMDSDDSIKLKLQVEGTGAEVTLTCWEDRNIDGAGFSGYTLLTTVVDDDDGVGGRIVTAGNVGLYARNTNVIFDNFNAEDLTAGGASPMPLINQYYSKLLAG